MAEVPEEELKALPEAQILEDPLYEAQIKKTHIGQTFMGKVKSIDMGMESGDRLYLIEYEDGDMEHMTAEEVESVLVSKARRAGKKNKKRPAAAEDVEEAEDGEADAEVKKGKVSKRPAGAPKAAPKAAIKAAPKAAMKAAPKVAMKAASKAVMKAAPKAAMKAAGKAKAKAKSKVKAKAKPKKK